MHPACCVIDTICPIVGSGGPTEVNVTMPAQEVWHAARDKHQLVIVETAGICVFTILSHWFSFVSSERGRSRST